MRFSIAIIIACFFYNFTSYATDSSEVILYIGQGKIDVKVYGVDVDPKLIVKLELELQKDSELADKVISSVISEIKIDSDKLDTFVSLNKSNPEAGIEELKNIIFKNIRPQNYQVENSTVEDLQFSKDGKKLVVAGNFVLNEEQSIEELVVVSGNATIKGKVHQLKIIGGSVHITETGVIENPIEVIGGSYTFDKGAMAGGKEIEESSNLISDFNLNFDSNSEEVNKIWNMISPVIKKLISSNFIDGKNGYEMQVSPIWVWSWRLFKLFSILIFTLILYLISPYFFKEMEVQIIDDLFATGLWGVSSIILMFPAMLLLIISIIGILLIPFVSIMYMYFAALGCPAIIKQALVRANIVKSDKVWATLIISVIILEVLGWIPYIGISIHIILTITAFGAGFRVLYNRFKSRKKRIEPKFQETIIIKS